MTNERVLAEIKNLRDQGSEYHKQGRHALALQCYQKAIASAVTLNDSGLTAYLLAQAGSEHRDCDNYHHAADLLLAALAIIPDTDESLGVRAQIRKVLAITLKDIFGPQKVEVLQLLEESRDDYIRSGNFGQEANVLQHIGGCYTQLNRLSDADRTLTEALKKAQIANDKQLEGWIYNDFADLEIERNEWGLALEYTRTARKKVQAVQDLEGEGDTWVTEARILLRMSHTEDALLAARHALDLYLQNQNLRRSIRARRHVAKALVSLERLEDAKNALKEALQTTVRLDMRHEQAIVYLELAQIELGCKNYGLAHENGVNARRVAESESLEDLVAEADDLLRRCHTEEHHQD